LGRQPEVLSRHCPIACQFQDDGHGRRVGNLWRGQEQEPLAVWARDVPAAPDFSRDDGGFEELARRPRLERPPLVCTSTA
jgi:hypothetical protein